jgi:hypothetical protein
MLRRAPLGLQENLYPSGLSEHSGAGRPKVKNMELDLQSLFTLHMYSCTHWLRPPQLPASPRIWAHIRGRYLSAKIDDISLYPPVPTPCSKINHSEL